MKSHLIVAGMATALLTCGTTSSAAPASGVGPKDIRSMVGLIEYLYAGYDNGANERKSFFETVPWDIDTGALIARVDTCQRSGAGEVIDYDWPSDSQDPMIKNLTVTFEGSPAKDHATVRATFSQGDPKPVVIHYDMTLYQDAPLGRRKYSHSGFSRHRRPAQEPQPYPHHRLQGIQITAVGGTD